MSCCSYSQSEVRVSFFAQGSFFWLENTDRGSICMKRAIQKETHNMSLQDHLTTSSEKKTVTIKLLSDDLNERAKRRKEIEKRIPRTLQS